MTLSAFARLFSLVVATTLCGQTTFQQREDLSFEQRIARLEAEREGLKEDMKAARADIDGLKEALKTVREQAKSADDLSKTNDGRLNDVTTIGRILASAVVFLLGVIVTQFVSRMMTRKSRIIKPA